MKLRLRYSCCPVFALMIYGILFSQVEAQEKAESAFEGKINEVLQADNASEVARHFGELFETVGRKGLAELMQSSHDSIALQAAWEEVLMTIPEKINHNHPTFRPDSGKLNWFIGFLEGRARIRVPKWWRSAVLDARANHRDNVYFPYQNWGRNAPNSAHPTTITKSGDRFSVNTGSNSLQLSNEVLEVSLAEGSNFSKMREAIEEVAEEGQSEECSYHFIAHFTAKRCYLAVHQQICTVYLLACLDRENGKILWKSKGIGCFWGGIGGGVGRARVSVDIQNNQVLFFECDGIGEIYFESFRQEDGKPLYRFSNKFSEYRSE